MSFRRGQRTGKGHDRHLLWCFGKGEGLRWGDGIGDPNLVRSVSGLRSELKGPGVLGGARSRLLGGLWPPTRKWPRAFSDGGSPGAVCPQGVRGTGTWGEHDWVRYSGGTRSLLAREDGNTGQRRKEGGKVGSRTKGFWGGIPSHHSKEDAIFQAKLGVAVR